MIYNVLLMFSAMCFIACLWGWVGEDLYRKYTDKRDCIVCNGYPACWVPWYWSYNYDTVVDHPNVCLKHIKQIHRIGNLEHEVLGIDKYS